MAGEQKDQRTAEVVRGTRELLEKYPKQAVKLLKGAIEYQKRCECPDNVAALEKILREEYSDA